MKIIKKICKHKEYKFDISKFGFKDNGKDEYSKIISNGKIFDYYSAYNNMSNYWIIKYIKNMCGITEEVILFYGKIPNKRFGKKLLKNILIK